MVDGNVFRLRGEFWQLSFDGKTKFLKDSIGMGYIARLLMEPNVSIPAVTRLAARAGIDPLAATGSSGEILDNEAREKYGRRYRELLEALTSELASATGLGGRSRQKSDFERVRKAVSMAVTRDIDKIGKHHESPGRHLDAAIDRGVTLHMPQSGTQTGWCQAADCPHAGVVCAGPCPLLVAVRQKIPKSVPTWPLVLQQIYWIRRQGTFGGSWLLFGEPLALMV